MNFKLLFLIFFTLPSLVISQQVEFSPFSYKGSQASLHSEQINSAVEDAVILSFDESQMSRIMSERPLRLNLNVPINNNRSAKLVLERFEILSQGANIIERKNSTETDRQDLRDLIVSYKGVYAEDENSVVSLNFTKTGVRGLMLTENETYVLGDLENSFSGDYILYEESKLNLHNDFLCGTDGLPSGFEETISKINSSQIDHSSTNLLVAEVAVEIDLATYNSYGGSMENTLSYALSLMATSSVLYMKDVNIRIAVPYIRVWTTPDPYTGTSSGVLLEQFRNEWNANQSGIQRTIAHFISRRAGASNLGGVAFLNVLCSSTFNGYGYGFSNTTGTINQLPLFSWDVMVVTHEMGHNFGSPHTHCWPGTPLDSCYNQEGGFGCYNGPAIAGVGTIMSYCHLNGSIKLDFGLLPGNLIRQTAESAFCISTSNEALVLGYPNGGESYNTNTIAKIYWGTNLTGNVNLEYSSNGGAAWNTIQNNVPAQDRQYDWLVPFIPGTAEGKIRILDSSNPSIGDTSNANFRIRFVFDDFFIVYPPSNSIIVTSPNSPDTTRFVWTVAASIPVTYKMLIRKLTPTSSPNYFFQSDNSGTETIRTMTKGKLDSLAELMGAVSGDTVSCIWRAYAYSGIDSGLSANSFIVKLARLTVGINPISSVVPDKFYLDNNYPNPFNPTTKIRFDIAKLEKVNITIFDMLGRKVEVLVNEQVQPGKYEVEFNASGFSSGIYYYRMETSEYVQTRKMILLK